VEYKMQTCFTMNCDRLIYNTVYSELTASNPTLSRWLQHRYKQSRLCVTQQWPRQTLT